MLAELYLEPLGMNAIELAKRLFERFAHLVEETGVHCAVVLMVPRRVGKTVLLHHVIACLLAGGEYGRRDIGYISLDHPLYTRLSIEEAADEIRRASKKPACWIHSIPIHAAP